MQESKSLKVEGGLLRALYFCFYGSGGSWFPYFNIYLQQIGFTGTQIGAFASIRTVLLILCQPLWGIGADIWGRRRALLLMLLLSAVLLPGFGLGTNFWFLLGWLILFAFVFSPGQPLVDSRALDYLDRDKKSSFGQLRLWGAVGWAVFAYAVGIVIEDHDTRLIFLFGSGMLLLSWYLVLRTPKSVDGADALTLNLQNLRPVLRNRRLLIFLILITLASVGMASTFSFFPIYMNELGASTQLIGFAFAIQGLSELPFYILAAPIMKKIGIIQALVFSLLIFSGRAFLYAFITDPAIAVASQVLHGAFALFLVSAIACVNLLVPKAWRATGQSLLSVAHMGLGGMIGHLLAGILYDHVGIHQMFFISGTIVLITGLSALIVLRQKSSEIK